VSFSIDPFDYCCNSPSSGGNEVTISFFGRYLGTISITEAADPEDVFEYFLSKTFEQAMRETVEHYSWSLS
jgi:hypothetical protein